MPMTLSYIYKDEMDIISSLNNEKLTLMTYFLFCGREVDHCVIFRGYT